MMINLPTNTALLIIDVQQGFDEPVWGTRNNPDAETHMAQLLEVWRTKQRPIFHVQHCSVSPRSPLQAHLPGNAFKPEVMPTGSEPIIQKNVNSAFIGTSLGDQLRASHINSLVIVGLTTDHCVSTTVRMASNMGYQVWLVADATATFDRHGHDGTWYSAETLHQTTLASLHGEFATVVDTADVLGE